MHAAWASPPCNLSHRHAPPRAARPLGSSRLVAAHAKGGGGGGATKEAKSPAASEPALLLTLSEMREKLQLYNTMARSKQPFRTRASSPEEVQMYVCGVTVYDLSHIGERQTRRGTEAGRGFSWFWASGFRVSGPLLPCYPATIPSTVLSCRFDVDVSLGRPRPRVRRLRCPVPPAATPTVQGTI